MTPSLPSRSVLLAASVVLLLGLWMASGLLSEAETTAETESDVLPAMQVEAAVIQQRSMQRELILTGELDARRHLQIRARTSGNVARIPIQRGDRIAEGALIVELDATDREADREEAEARVAAASREQAAAQSLGRQGLQSEMQQSQSDAELATARAQLARIRRDIADTRIRAPFDGVVNSLPIEIGQLMERGDRVAELLDISAYDVTAQVPQQRVDELEPGQTLSVELITGEQVEATLTWISRLADAATRSFAIEARVTGEGRELPTGISARLRIPVETVEAVFVTPSVLSLDEQGELGVKVVDQDNRVSFVAVSLIESTIEGAWVSGLDENSRVITLGQGFVSDGEIVRVKPSSKSLTPPSPSQVPAAGDG